MKNGGAWTAVSNLVSGDELRTQDGRIVFVQEVRIEKLAECIRVYNLEIEGLHTYYVAGGVLVHNACGDGAVYNPSPKHDPVSGWGSQNPIPNVETGQTLLDTAYSSSKNKQLYNIYDGGIIKFQPDTVDGWHAYLVENISKEVPTDVLRQMLNDELITKSQYNKFIKNKG